MTISTTIARFYPLNCQESEFDTMLNLCISMSTPSAERYLLGTHKVLFRWFCFMQLGLYLQKRYPKTSKLSKTKLYRYTCFVNIAS